MSIFEGELSNAVGTGWVRPRSARLWLRSERQGPLRVVLREPDGRVLDERPFEPPSMGATDGTATFRWPEDVGGRALEPNRSYDYQIVRPGDDTELGQGRLLTPPAGWDDCPERFTIAVASCHQPFAEDGRSSEKARRLVNQVHSVLDDHGVKAVVLCGDQVYTDLPPELSLFDEGFFAQVAPPGRSSVLECSREEVRALIQGRYRAFWSMDGFQRLQARWACHPIPDDHDIVDNFGSDPAHSEPRWRTFRDGALDACHDYQTCRVLGRPGDRPPSLHHTFRWGPLGVFVMDLRSAKQTDGHLCSVYSDAQLADLEHFLRSNEDAGMLAIVLSVPLAHVPEWFANAGKSVEGEGGDMADRWAQPATRRARDRLMAILHEHRVRRPWQPLVLFGGDVHTGAISELRWGDGTTGSVYQLTSSPLTNDEERHLQLGSAMAHESLQTIEGEGYPPCDVRLMPGVATKDYNPVPELNVGLLEVSIRDGRCFFRMKLLALDGDETAVVYESAELPGPLGGGPAARGDYVD